MTNLLNFPFIACDTPRLWGMYFQDTASPQMEALVELHDNIMFYLVIILFGVAWILVSVIRNYINNKSPISNKYLNNGTLIELIWTITPALILILIAFPSFKLLYLMDEVTDPSLTVFVEGHQWYWSYEYPDFLDDEGVVLFSEELPSDSESEAFVPDNVSIPDEEIPDPVSEQGHCEHSEGWLNYPEFDPETLCDFCPSQLGESHSAFSDENPIYPQVCKICHAIRCQDCNAT